MNLEAMIRGLQDVFKEYLLKNPKLSKELGMQVEAIRDLKHLVDVIAANMPFSFEDAQEGPEGKRRDPEQSKRTRG